MGGLAQAQTAEQHLTTYFAIRVRKIGLHPQKEPPDSSMYYRKAQPGGRDRCSN